MDHMLKIFKVYKKKIYYKSNDYDFDKDKVTFKEVEGFVYKNNNYKNECCACPLNSKILYQGIRV